MVNVQITRLQAGYDRFGQWIDELLALLVDITCCAA